MPNLDGLGVLASLPREGAPRVIVVSSADADSDLGVEGAPGGRHRSRREADGARDRAPLRPRGRAGPQGARRRRARRSTAQSRRPRRRPRLARSRRSRRTRVVVIGASTGGPHGADAALRRRCPPGSPSPSSSRCTSRLATRNRWRAAWIDASALSIVEASDDLAARARARGPRARGRRTSRSGATWRAPAPASWRTACLDTLYCPSVDLLFASAARVFGAGRPRGRADGHGGRRPRRRARAIRAAGGRSSPESRVVLHRLRHAPPRVEAGLAAAEAPIEQMPAAILRHL